MQLQLACSDLRVHDETGGSENFLMEELENRKQTFLEKRFYHDIAQEKQTEKI